MAEVPRATVRLIAKSLYDTPYDGCSGDELAQATGLSVRDFNHAVDWLEFYGYAHVDRSLGGSKSYHFFVAVELTERGRRACEQKRL